MLRRLGLRTRLVTRCRKTREPRQRKTLAVNNTQLESKFVSSVGVKESEAYRSAGGLHPWRRLRSTWWPSRCRDRDSQQMTRVWRKTEKLHWWMERGFFKLNTFICAFLFPAVIPDQLEVALGAGDVCGKLIRSAAATRPVALRPGTAGVVQLIDLQYLAEAETGKILWVLIEHQVRKIQKFDPKFCGLVWKNKEDFLFKCQFYPKTLHCLK